MMVSRTMSLGTHEFGFLKETLDAQQELLQKLYKELDDERESSAVAADETLSMMLRLQAERAAMEMEANQYKRIAEEKMCHTEETLETFHELIYQKEMRIASLEFQVQAYKFKLESLGFDDLASCDMKYPENMLSRKNGLVGEISPTNSVGTLKRGYSLPPRRDSNSYREEIKKLDVRVKGLTSLNSLNSFSVPEVSSNPPESSSLVHNHPADNSDLHENSEKVANVRSGEFESSISVQDIFHVPQCSDDNKIGQTELSSEKETGNRTMNGGRSPPTSDPKEINDLEKQPEDRKSENKLLKNLTFGVSDFEFKQFGRRLKQLEDERFLSTVRESNCENGDEELKLLREIVEKVDAVQSEISSWKTKKPSPPEVDSVGCFKEVILRFFP